MPSTRARSRATSSRPPALVSLTGNTSRPPASSTISSPRGSSPRRKKSSKKTKRQNQTLQKKRELPDAYQCPRQKPDIVYDDWSKLNIAPLFDEEGAQKHPILYQAAQRLLCDLYGSLLTPAAAKELLDALLEEPLKSEPISSLLAPDHLLAPLLLKIAYGTGSYTLAKAEGYPPFAHFFRWDDKKPKSLCYLNLSTPVLRALFGPELTSAIAAAEKEKWEKGGENKKHGLTMEELGALLQNQNAQLPASLLKDYFLFSYKAKGGKQIGITDETSGTRVEKPLR